MSDETDIRPFRVDMPGEAIADLRRRIAATRLPSEELVKDRSQGVQPARPGSHRSVGFCSVGFCSVGFCPCGRHAGPAHRGTAVVTVVRAAAQVASVDLAGGPDQGFRV